MSARTSSLSPRLDRKTSSSSLASEASASSAASSEPSDKSSQTSLSDSEADTASVFDNSAYSRKILRAPSDSNATTTGVTSGATSRATTNTSGTIKSTKDHNDTSTDDISTALLKANQKLERKVRGLYRRLEKERSRQAQTYLTSPETGTAMTSNDTTLDTFASILRLGETHNIKMDGGELTCKPKDPEVSMYHPGRLGWALTPGAYPIKLPGGPKDLTLGAAFLGATNIAALTQTPMARTIADHTAKTAATTGNWLADTKAGSIFTKATSGAWSALSKAPTNLDATTLAYTGAATAATAAAATAAYYWRKGGKKSPAETPELDDEKKQEEKTSGWTSGWFGRGKTDAATTKDKGKAVAGGVQDVKKSDEQTAGGKSRWAGLTQFGDFLQGKKAPVITTPGN